jgi:site-specific DNA-methyltransferase (adenine-specific)
MVLNKALFSSNSDEWETPQKLFDELNEEFNFYCDLASTSKNAKCSYWLDKHDNALLYDWTNLPISESRFQWLNPPYSNIKDWVKKAYEENLKGAKIVMLIPARTDTIYFHQWIYKNPNVEIRFIKGRLKFSDSKNSAPFPSMIVVWK